ncbi:MAG: RNA polymerase sigma factor [Planctomycetota bacterium]|jgi:RNA polymerase sigma-70 factor (ECF subfamily)
MPMMDKKAEIALVTQAKAGNARAIEALIRAHQEALYAFILRMSGRPDVAEDIVQEAFVRVLKNIDRFDSRFRFSTWIFTIAKRLYVNASQKHKPSYDSDTVGSRQGRMPTPGRLVSRHETMRNIRGVLDAALGDLNQQQREIILLFHQQCWPITDIADHLQMPEGTVKSHLHRARKRMRRMIEANSTLHQQTQEAWA